MVAGVFGLALMGLAQADEPSVLVALDAPLVTQPDSDEDKAKIDKKADTEAHPENVGYAELVSRDDGWAQLRMSVHSRACHQPLGSNAPPGMILWVKPNHIMRVVQKGFTFQDGAAKVEVFPGAAVRENVDATLTVAAEGLHVTGNFPIESVGYKFTPELPSDSSFQPTHGGSGLYGTEKLKIELHEAALTPAKGSDTWAIERRCVRAVGPRLEGEAPVEGAGTPDARGGAGRRVKDAIPLQEGTILQWPDGVYAGTLSRRYAMPGNVEENPEGLICGKVNPGVVVCAPDPAKPIAAPPVRYIALDLKATDTTEAKHPKGDLKGQSAKCRVQIDVGKNGKAQEVEARGCAEAFQEAAKKAVEEWTFKPYQVDGQPVLARTWTWIEFTD